ncbi:MAG: SCP2 sterol-binding domain-containing protein [Lentibacter algarum]
MDMNEIAEGIARGLEGKSFEGSLKFDFGTEGVIILRDGEVTTEDGPTDCTLKISKENLGKLLTGKLNAMTGVMTGKLKASGDLSVAMRLEKLL